MSAFFIFLIAFAFLSQLPCSLDYLFFIVMHLFFSISFDLKIIYKICLKIFYYFYLHSTRSFLSWKPNLKVFFQNFHTQTVLLRSIRSSIDGQPLFSTLFQIPAVKHNTENSVSRSHDNIFMVSVGAWVERKE